MVEWSYRILADGLPVVGQLPASLTERDGGG
jgi:hypothetical protein